jgi:subtilisin family serine protease
MTKRCVFSLLNATTPLPPTCVPQVRNAIKRGVPVIVSAGNGVEDENGNFIGEDANNKSPSRVDEAIVVGATTIDDTFAPFSNFGSKVDILAPGDEIISASNRTDDDEDILTGSSQSA